MNKFVNNALPKFKECAKHPHADERGYVLYYTSQCLFNAKYVITINLSDIIPLRIVSLFVLVRFCIRC